MSAWHFPLMRAASWLRAEKLQCERLADDAGEGVVQATAQERARSCGGAVAKLERVLVEHDVALPGPPGTATRARVRATTTIAGIHAALRRAIVARHGSQAQIAGRLEALRAELQALNAPDAVIADVARIEVPAIAPWSAAAGEPTC